MVIYNVQFVEYVISGDLDERCKVYVTIDGDEVGTECPKNPKTGS